MIQTATSSPILPVSWHKGELRILPVIVVVCSCVSLWSTVHSGTSLTYNLITSHAIALSQWSLSLLVRLFFRGRLPIWGIVMAIPAGVVIGSRLASFTGAPDFAWQMLRDPGHMRQVILESAMLGIVITAFFLYFSHSRGVKEALERERRRAAEALQAETASRLALLQAQIEPHFLFNTLANIHSLIKEDPEAASLVLEELNVYLRSSLRRSRQMASTVGEELELVEALLAIAGARLGTRLEYTISAPADLRAVAFPPLLLQPLVENAIRHGIEPAVAGGKIHVEVRKQNDALELTVSDTGVGLNTEAPEGVGLANIRARLASLHGPGGKLEFYANAPRGVIAKLIVPAAIPRAAL